MSHEGSVMKPVIHHIELCVRDIDKTLKILQKYGFTPFAKRETAICKSVAARLNSIVFIVTQKTAGFTTHNKLLGSMKYENFSVLCSNCENVYNDDDHVDSAFNVALNVKNVHSVTDRIKNYDPSSVLKTATFVEDTQDGKVCFSIIKSLCGNIVHTLINKDYYKGFFLPGYEQISCVNYDNKYSEHRSEIINSITHVDHVTLACSTGDSTKILKWYEQAFGMEKFKISRDEKEDGLILEQGVGLRIKAMEYWLCSETGLVYYPESKSSKERSQQSMMLVVVESLPGQKNCNIENFLRNHGSAGIEHIALSTRNISRVVRSLKTAGVKFRSPPDLYYDELKLNKIDTLVNMDEVQRLGILVDREDTDGDEDGNEAPKILMQIFAEPFFKEKKTFFIEIIQRIGGIGLGSGNVVALLKSIREAERRKALEEHESLSTKEERTDTRIC